ncbi:MAG: hypothetical protein H7A35_01730 [Planctomycetales bacterium]|nr:hypothetical protein [bacterium]UNM08778.1 MAG: hypothetical protein H7A35_01730 [Planctomycetales bacterium]
MGRSDINTLSVSFEPAPRAEIKPEITLDSLHSARKVESLLTELHRCPSCDSKLSKPEAKMGRCLSCGSKLLAEQGEENKRSFTIGI